MQPETQIKRLDNGLRVATTSMPHMASTAVGFWVGSGSRHETSVEHGMAHLVEHMVFKGTPTRSSMDISRQIEGIGASIDGFTVEDHTAYHAKGPADQFEPMFEVMSDFFLNPTLDPAEIESEKQVIREEIAMVRDLPGQYLEDLISEAAWGMSHPLGRSITGTEASLESFQRSHIHNFFQRSYCGENAVISVAGNIEHGKIQDFVADKMSGLKAGNSAVPQPAPAPEILHRFHEENDQEQSHVALSFPGVDRFHKDRFALKLLDVILGENMSSRLFQKIREEKGLCYEIQSDLVSFSDAGLLQIYLALSPENLAPALDGILEVITDIRLDGIAERELREAKAYLVGQSRISLENTSSQMMWAGETLLFFNEWIEAEEAHRKVMEVTVDEVLAAAREYLNPRALCSALIGSGDSCRTLERWLGAIA